MIMIKKIQYFHQKNNLGRLNLIQAFPIGAYN